MGRPERVSGFNIPSCNVVILNEVKDPCNLIETRKIIRDSSKPLGDLGGSRF